MATLVTTSNKKKQLVTMSNTYSPARSLLLVRWGAKERQVKKSDSVNQISDMLISKVLHYVTHSRSGNKESARQWHRAAPLRGSSDSFVRSFSVWTWWKWRVSSECGRLCERWLTGDTHDTQREQLEATAATYYGQLLASSCNKGVINNKNVYLCFIWNEFSIGHQRVKKKK